MSKLILFLLIYIFSLTESELINLSVQRDVDLLSQLVKISTKIYFHNFGTHPTNTYIYLLQWDMFYLKFTNQLNETLRHEANKVVINNRQVEQITVYLKTNLLPNEKTHIHVEEVHVNAIKSLQKKRKFEETELLGYNCNVMYYSGYDTLKYDITFVTSKKYHTSLDPDTISGYRFGYNFVNFKSISEKEVNFEFSKKNGNFHVSLDRIIDVSHYGKIMIEDDIRIENKGGIVYGPFKPFPGYQQFSTHLPASAESVNYFDPIGLIYSYSVIDFNHYKTMKFKTRFPLYSGWKITYTINYMVPMYEYLYKVGENRFKLKMRVFDHVLDDAVVDNLVTRIILPENAYDLDVTVPSAFRRMEDDISVTHLTCFGRKTVVVNGGNLVEDHISDFEIDYTLDPISLLRVPFKLCCMCFALFGTYLISKKLCKMCAI